MDSDDTVVEFYTFDGDDKKIERSSIAQAMQNPFESFGPVPSAPKKPEESAS